jgi:L-threonylcarbamoyladenylate synthase
MIQTPRELTQLLRQGKLIGLADETGFSVACDPQNDEAVTKLLQLQADMESVRRGDPLLPTVLVQDANQVTLYVSKMPEIAFDLVDFANKPLTVLYAQGKNVSSVLLDKNPEIAVRKSLNPEIQRFIGGFSKGLLTLPFETSMPPKPAQDVIEGGIGQVIQVTKKPQIMRLGVNGEVEFIRR